ncbi:MAG TPA: DUF2946 family protein [Rhizomicrobium sp.]|nr:DUF2946 family protein [Rhizomicrobium sp.]
MVLSLRHVGFRLALAAMLLRALVPDGWMPNTTGTPGVPFAICTINGPVTLSGAQDPAGKHAPNDARHMDVCPFAAAPHAAVFSRVVAPTLPSQSLFAVLSVPEPIPTEPARPYAPQSPRAPPLFV